MKNFNMTTFPFSPFPDNKPHLMWRERIGDELYVFYKGELIYKRWLNPPNHEPYGRVMYNFVGE